MAKQLFGKSLPHYAGIEQEDVPGVGKLTYLGQISTDNCGWSEWPTEARFLLSLTEVVNTTDLEQALRDELFPWSIENLTVTDTGIIIPVRYRKDIFDPRSLICRWANGISDAYAKLRQARLSWPKGIDIGGGMMAFRTGPGFKGEVYIFVHVALPDIYGSNKLVMHLPADEMQRTGVLSQPVLASLPVEFSVPCGFFD